MTGLDPAAVLPTIGSKELVALLPLLLGVGPGDLVVLPELAYPTYEVGVRLAGAEPVRADGLLAAGPGPVRLVWVNSPANPTGRVLPADHLRKVVAWARERGAVVVSDECYLEFGWDAEPISVLHPSRAGRDARRAARGALAVQAVQPRRLPGRLRRRRPARWWPALLEVRKHAGLIVPAPVQAAATAAFGDDGHVAEQRAPVRGPPRGAAPRAGGGRLHRRALRGRALPVGDPRRGLLGRRWTGWPALGILVAPGDFYGPAGGRHVRVALTATDERVAAAAARLPALELEPAADGVRPERAGQPGRQRVLRLPAGAVRRHHHGRRLGGQRGHRPRDDLAVAQVEAAEHGVHVGRRR